MLGIGEKFPEFKLKAVVSVEEGKEFSDLDSASLKGKWRVIFFLASRLHICLSY